MFLPLDVLPLDFLVCLCDSPAAGYSAKVELIQPLPVGIPQPVSRLLLKLPVFLFPARFSFPTRYRLLKTAMHFPNR